MLRTSLKFNNKKKHDKSSSKLRHKNIIPKFSLLTKKNVLHTQPAVLQSFAKQALCQLSQINIQLSKHRKSSNTQNLPQITPWIQSIKDDNTQNSNTLPLFKRQNYCNNSMKKLQNAQKLRNIKGVLNQYNRNSIGYTTFIKYPSQKPIKTQAIQPLCQKILIIDKANTEQNYQDYSSVKTFHKIKRQKRKQLLDDTKYITQQTNPVLVKRKHQSLKAYNISNVSKDVEVLRNQIICSIQKQAVIPLNSKLSSISKNKSTVINPLLRRKFSLRGKFNQPSLTHHNKQNYSKQKQKQNNNNSYQTSNPLTKVLYQRYIKTLSKENTKF